jgi:hypothetical protein
LQMFIEHIESTSLLKLAFRPPVTGILTCCDTCHALGARCEDISLGERAKNSGSYSKSLHDDSLLQEHQHRQSTESSQKTIIRGPY